MILILQEIFNSWTQVNHYDTNAIQVGYTPVDEQWLISSVLFVILKGFVYR